MTDSIDDDPENYATQDAVVSTQGARVRLPMRVAPAVDGTFNTVRPTIAAIACFRLNEALFDFDSSLLRPTVRAAMPRFAALLAAHPGALASVFGHADASGTDEYNRALSVRRAQSLYGLLTRDTALWEKLHQTPLGSDNWGVRSLQVMLGTVPDPSALPQASYLSGEPSGFQDGKTLLAVKQFQADKGLTVDGIAGPQTRKALFLAYMDAVCVDGNGAPYSMTPAQFVGRGAPNGKGSHQGCSEFNPVTILSQADQAQYDTGARPRSERNARNAPNRRAMVFLFPPTLPITAADWPCPTAEEGPSACRKMFWPDGDARRSPGSQLREYRNDHRTMACTWYDRFARHSPCEGRTFTRIAITLRDKWTTLLEGAPYRIRAAGRERTGRTPDGLVTLTVPGIPERCLVEWGRPGDSDIGTEGKPPAFSLELYVTYESGSTEDQASKRLHNIGYPDSYAFEVRVRAFQRDAGLPLTGKLDDATVLALIAAHGTLATSVESLEEVAHG